MISEGVASDWFIVSAGVPQGCVLSPLLFLVFINDLPQPSDLLTLLFADDGALIPPEHGATSHQSLQHALNFTYLWSLAWGLDFSCTKSVVVVFHNKRNPPVVPPFLLGSATLPSVATFQYLGCHFDSNGKPGSQTTHIISKARHQANFISNLCSPNRPPKPAVIKTLVNTLLIPVISYGLAFWRPSQSTFESLDSVIASPLRRVLGLPPSVPTSAILDEFGLTNSLNLRKKALLQFRCWNLKHNTAFSVVALWQRKSRKSSATGNTMALPPIVFLP